MPAQEQRIVVNCPMCLRVIWYNSVCHHGRPPEGTTGAPKEPEIKDVPEYKQKTRDRHRPKPD